MKLDVARLPASPVSRDILDEADTLDGGLRTLVERAPDFPILTFLDARLHEQRLTFADLWERVRRVQAGMAAQGLRPGRVVLLALPTSPELCAAYFGVMLAGGLPALVTTPANRFAHPRIYANLIAPILRIAGAQFLYGTPEVAAICRENTELPLGDTRVITAEELATSVGAPPAIRHESGEIAMVQYSSGSTGRSKGVLLTHRAILNKMRATREGLGAYADDVSVSWLPLYHDLGLIDTYLRPVFSGSPTVLIATPDFVREPSLWLWAIHRYRATVSLAPNFAFALCAKRIPGTDLEGLDLSSLRVAGNGSEPCLADSIEAFTDRFSAYGFAPNAMTPMWGCAEAVCIGTAKPAGEAPLVETVDRHRLATENVARPTPGDGLRLVSVGKCMPDCTIEIRDANGNALPARGVGEIWLRTASMFAGYQGDPDLTSRVLVDGWVDTGDRGYLAGDYLFFVSREKDLIVIGGEKYGPLDIEMTICRVPGVRPGCAVAFGVTNEDRGTDDIGAVVETHETDPVAQAALREAIRREVTGTTGLALRWVVLTPPGGIQKTTSGKLARAATRERHREKLT